MGKTVGGIIMALVGIAYIAMLGIPATMSALVLLAYIPGLALLGGGLALLGSADKDAREEQKQTTTGAEAPAAPKAETEQLLSETLEQNRQLMQQNQELIKMLSEKK